MASLVLGPLLRHIGSSDATVWLEASDPCEVEILGRRERTFAVEEHHYAIVALEGLTRGSSTPYEVELDGKCVWPDPGLGLPPSTIRTIDPDRPFRLAFGSCRTAGPHEPPFTHRRASDPRGLGIDALRALAIRTARSSDDERPDALLMLGDQVYADQPSIRISDFVREHETQPGAPPVQLEDFTEYCRAYCDTWSDPYVRWLLSTVPSAMIFDDHEIHDEWKISQAWVEEMRSKEWYDRRVTSGLMAYWLYQHLGNLSPAELAADDLLQRIREAEDGGTLLREFARHADRQCDHSRWSYCRDFGRTRLVVFDSRGGRDLTPGRRRIVNEREWDWIVERTRGEFDHVLLASSIPFLVSHGMHWLEAWVEAVADGAWGSDAARVGERLRQASNAGHWAGFQRSFEAFASLLESLATRAAGRPPYSVLLLSGDVHHCYAAKVGFRSGATQRPVWQVVCSGLRKQLDPREKAVIKIANSRFGRAAGRALARTVDIRESALTWTLVERPRYVNQVATVELDGPVARVRVETTAGVDWRDPRLRPLFVRSLSGPSAVADDR